MNKKILFFLALILVKSAGYAGSHSGPYSLHVASEQDNARVILQLLSENFDINSFNDYGFTPLMSAAKMGRVNACRILLENGAE